MVLIAHAGHWAMSLLEVAPLFAVLGVLAVRSLRGRKAQRRPQAS